MAFDGSKPATPQLGRTVYLPFFVTQTKRQRQVAKPAHDYIAGMKTLPN